MFKILRITRLKSDFCRSYIFIIKKKCSHIHITILRWNFPKFEPKHQSEDLIFLEKSIFSCSQASNHISLTFSLKLQLFCPLSTKDLRNFFKMVDETPDGVFSFFFLNLWRNSVSRVKKRIPFFCSLWHDKMNFYLEWRHK